MKICKYCSNEIDDDSIYCKYCGNRVVRMKNEVKVPKPHRLADGTYTAQIMVNGVRRYVYGKTLAEYRANAVLERNNSNKELHEQSTKLLSGEIHLGEILNRYIDSNTAILSPSTIRGYYSTANGRFLKYKDMPVGDIDFQVMLNEEASLCSAKTLKNAWGLVTAALHASGIPVPDVNLPAVPATDEPWLNYKEIQIFLEAIRGKPSELCAILALHSLRMSELDALTVEENIKDDSIIVKGALVRGPDEFVFKDTNKTQKSTRVVPIMIPRLLELLPESGKVMTISQAQARNEINKVCAENNLPMVCVHGLRRSFASLAYHLGWSERSVMQVGGWSNIQTVHKIYIKLDQSDVNKDIKKMSRYYKST